MLSCIKKIILTSILSAVCLSFNPAYAGQYSDDLGRCLVQNANTADTKILTQWAFVTIGQTQAAKEVVIIPRQKVEAISTKAQTTVLRLLAKDCAAPALKATLYEGKNGVPNGIKYAVMQYMQNEMQTRTVDALISKLANLKTP